MFFILSKILALFIHPLFWIVFSLLMWLFLKNRKWKKRSKIAFLICFFLFTNKFTALLFHHAWEADGTKTEELAEDYDIAIVLGGMAKYDYDLERIILHKGADRIWNAIRLYKLGKVKKILVSGADGKLLDESLNEAQAFKKDLLILGIPEEDVLIEDQSRNTYQNAAYSKELLVELGMEDHKLLLITSAMHMNRASACFEKQGLDFDTFAVDANSGDFYFDLGHLLIPDQHAIELWHQLFHEITGYIVYKMVGYA